MNSLVVDRNAQGIVTLIMNRPKVHNAFDDALIELLLEQLQQLAVDPELRVLILTASGKSFSAGADLNWMRRMAGYSEQENVKDSLRLAELMYQLNRFPAPVIAMVNGSAYGGGVGLIACCDIAIASSQCTFALSEVKLGLLPAVISPYVAAAIGQRQCRRYMLSGESFSSEAALRIGLIHEIVAEASGQQSLQEMVTQLAAQIASNGPKALRACKELIRSLASQPDLRDSTARLIAAIRVSPEGQEGLGAFLEKRAPDWPA